MIRQINKCDLDLYSLPIYTFVLFHQCVFECGWFKCDRDLFSYQINECNLELYSLPIYTFVPICTFVIFVFCFCLNVAGLSVTEICFPINTPILQSICKYTCERISSCGTISFPERWNLPSLLNSYFP